MKTLLNSLARSVLPGALRHTDHSLDEHTRQQVAMAMIFASSNRQRLSLPELGAAEFRAFSQWGEDGIIDWLIERLPGIPQRFVEFGVEGYTEANTRLLLHSRNWQGLVIDGSQSHIERLQQREEYWRFNLTAVADFITRENINELIGENGMQGEVGLLSVDIDGNDYWVWEAIDVISPWLVVCESNPVLGDLHALSIPYDPGFVASEAHYSQLYFGASLRALEILGKRKGYTLLGSNSNGLNLFFVRNDIGEPLVQAVEQVRCYPNRYRTSRDNDGKLDYLAPIQQAQVIDTLPLVNIETGKLTTLADIGPIESADWQRHRIGLPPARAGENTRT